MKGRRKDKGVHLQAGVRRAGMSRRTAKVKTRAKSRHHKNPSGRFWGTYGIGPSRNWAGRRRASAKNAPSTPERQRTSSAKKTRSDTQGNSADRGRTGKDHHESRHDQDIVVRSQKETEKNWELLHVKDSREVQPAPTQTTWGWDGQGKTGPPYWTQQFPQCDFARVWTVGTMKPTNRGAEVIQHLRPNNTGPRGRINQKQLWSEKLERRMWSMPENPHKARTRRKSGDLVKENAQPRTKGMHRSPGKSWGKTATTTGGGGGGGGNATLQVRRALRISKKNLW